MANCFSQENRYERTLIPLSCYLHCDSRVLCSKLFAQENDTYFAVYIIIIVYMYHFQAGPDGSEHIRVGKLNLVDLAGSERQSKTGSTVS